MSESSFQNGKSYGHRRSYAKGLIDINFNKAHGIGFEYALGQASPYTSRFGNTGRKPGEYMHHNSIKSPCSRYLRLWETHETSSYSCSDRSDLRNGSFVSGRLHPTQLLAAVGKMLRRSNVPARYELQAAIVLMLGLAVAIYAAAPIVFLLDWSLWTIIILAQGALVFAAFRLELRNSSPMFFNYLCFGAYKSLIMFGFWAVLRNVDLHRSLLISASIVGTVLFALVVREIWRKTLGAWPLRALPQGSTIVFVGILAAIYPATLTTFAFFQAHTPDQYLNAFLSIEFIVLAAGSSTLAAIIAYAYYLGIHSSKRVSLFAVGLVLCLSVNAVTAFISGRFEISIIAAQRVGQLAYLFCLGLWGRALWEKEPAIEKATQEEVARILANHQHTTEDAAKLLDPAVTV